MRGAIGRRRYTVAAIAVLLVSCSSAPRGDSPEPAVSVGAGEAGGAAAETPLDAPVDAPRPDATPEQGSLIATASVASVVVRDGPDDRAEVVHELDNPTTRGAPRVFLVDEVRGDWLHVLLPVRPNGSTGWVRARDVELTRTGLAVEVDLTAFELTVTRDGDEVLSSPIGYGAADTPTPGGRYYIIELLQPPDPDGVYGSFAFGLSGFSDVLLSFSGGEGVIGIHGTNDPSSIGRRVSKGCIRLPDEVIVELAALLPLGTPVSIVG